MKNCINDFSLSISQGSIRDPYGAVGLVRYTNTSVLLENFCCVVCAICAIFAHGTFVLVYRTTIKKGRISPPP
jgi:hypothetical protein